MVDWYKAAGLFLCLTSASAMAFVLSVAAFALARAL